MSARRVLIVRVGAMGDVLHALPAVTALRRLQPTWGIDWVVDPRWAPLLADENRTGPVVSHVHLAETRQWSRAPWSRQTRRSVLTLRRALREGAYDAVVDMQGTLRSAVLGRFAHAVTFAGFADPRERAARFFYRTRLPRRGAHVVEQCAALLGEAVGVPLEPAAPQIAVTHAAESWAQDLLRTLGNGGRVALLVPAAGWGAKQWPAAHFAAVAHELRSSGLTVLVNAAHEQDPVARAVMEMSAQAARTVVCSVAELVALTRRAALVIGGDTGPTHLAASLGTPLVALYGPTDPARNGPWGPGPMRVLRNAASRTSHKRIAETDPGLARLTVREVLDAAFALLRS